MQSGLPYSAQVNGTTAPSQCTRCRLSAGDQLRSLRSRRQLHPAAWPQHLPVPARHPPRPPHPEGSARLGEGHLPDPGRGLQHRQPPELHQPRVHCLYPHQWRDSGHVGSFTDRHPHLPAPHLDRRLRLHQLRQLQLRLQPPATCRSAAVSSSNPTAQHERAAASAAALSAFPQNLVKPPHTLTRSE